MRIPAYLACLGTALALAACGGEASPPSDAATEIATEGAMAEPMATESAMPEATESASPEASASASGAM